MNLLHRRPAPVAAGAPSLTIDDATATADTTPSGDTATGRRSRRRSGRRTGRLSRIGGTLLTVVMALALIVFVAMTVLRISGGELLAIRTGSMTPMMKPGDLLISREVDPRTIRRGDVITFRVPEADNTLVTHRVTKVDDKGNSFTTKGDANDTVDPFTTNAKDVLGIRWFSIPDVGRLMVFLSSGIGTALLIGIPAAIYFGQTIADRRALLRARDAAAEAPVADAAASAQVTEPPVAVPDPVTPVPPAESRDPHDPQHQVPPSFAPPTTGPSPFAAWGAPPWATQVHHVMPAPPPQVIVVQVPQQAPAPPLHPTPPPFHPSTAAPVPPLHPTPPPFHPTPPPYHPSTAPPAPTTGAAPIAVPAHRLPSELTQGLGAEWVLLCPIEPSVAAHLHQPT